MIALGTSNNKLVELNQAQPPSLLVGSADAKSNLKND